MAKTLTQLQQGVLIRLNEATASPFGQLEGGGGSGVVQTTTATITQYLDESFAEAFRTCLLLPGFGAAYTTAGVATYTLDNLSTQMDRTRSTANLYADGSVLWAARNVSWGGTALQFVGVEALQMRNGGFLQTTGTPRYWFRQGGDAIGIWPTPVTAAGLTAAGYCTPPSLNLSATAVWLTNELCDGIEVRASILLVEHSFDDPSLFGRIAHLRTEWQDYAAQNYTKIPQTLAADLSMPPPFAPQKK